MKVKRIRYLKGPNYFSYKPMMWVEIDLEELEFQPTNELPLFADSLLEAIPSIGEHTCSRGYKGAFAERLREGTWMGHVLEHIALELQSLAGIEVKYGKTVTSGKKGIYFIAFEYKEPESALYAFQSAKEIAEKILRGEKGFSVKPYIDKIADLYYKNKLGPSTESIYLAAAARNIPVERVGKDSFLRLGTGSKQKYVQATITSQTSYLAVEASCDKEMTKEMLRGSGIPVPEGEVAETLEGITEAAVRVGFPLVIKPLHGRQGQGVATGISSWEELNALQKCLKEEDKPYIVERHYEGSDYRLFVVDNQLRAASLRVPPFIIGNGTDTIQELIEKENENPLRGNGHEKPMTKIPMADSLDCFLEKMELNKSYVLEKGRVLPVAGNANLSTGGQAIDVTDEVHPSVRKMAEAAAASIGLDVAGVDIISKDIAKPLDPRDTCVLEVNAAPGIRMHLYPGKGKSRNAGADIVDYLFSSREEAAIPVIAVTGTNGKTTTSRLVKHFLEKEGTTVGLTSSDGVYVGDQCIDTGDCSGPISARKILSHPKVDIAVLESARGGILREGLAFRHCDVGIVTNVSEDHLGLDGIEDFTQLAKLKRLIPEVVIEGGYCILNADDPETLKMAAYTKGKVIYTSLDEESEGSRRALEKGEPLWYLDSIGQIVYAEAGIKAKFLPAADVPITINGRARHNIANLLQALAAAAAQGVSLETLKEKALSFMPDSTNSRGRFNSFLVQGREIIIDYAHNAAGLSAVFGTADYMKNKRLITILSAPGDRSDSDIARMAEITAGYSDLIIIKEDKDLRGRLPLETASLLKAAASTVMDSQSLFICPDELESYQKAWSLSHEGDTLLFLYEDFEVASSFIEDLKKHEQALQGD
ncbi:cyanophycin synthetase [Bacillus infantis]|uniref:cyanophycin synthetase n=1 Tax=Bacillus infantis TaxID=324767 RepID=UPI001CD7E1FB|nr:cyanophycin synthetase [Bacillus infantis]MCA1039613.1 cyanophycin synthetase [Bacillus infantis]